MKGRLLVAVGMSALGAAVLAADTPKPAAPKAAADKAAARGKYLLNAMGCHDCHTPKKMGSQGPEPDMTRMLSGHPEAPPLPPPPTLPPGPWIAVTNTDLTAWSGPWGISYAINLTSDENSGIGSWSEETFLKAMRTGRHMGVSRPILPPMPWFDIATLTDEDIKALYAYLRTIPVVKNRVPEPVIATPPAPGR
jgi:mono/diheme cytochrome c family protein